MPGLGECLVGGVPGPRGGAWSQGVPSPGEGAWSQGHAWSYGCLVPGGDWSWGSPGPQPRGKLRGDLVQAHNQGGNLGGSDPGPQQRGKLRGIWSNLCQIPIISCS